MTDFGMARNVHQDDIYTKRSRVRVSMELQLFCVNRICMHHQFVLVSFSIILFHKKGRLPVKWTAYEALLFGTYTTQSDV